MLAIVLWEGTPKCRSPIPSRLPVRAEALTASTTRAVPPLKRVCVRRFLGEGRRADKVPTVRDELRLERVRTGNLSLSVSLASILSM